jgi:hypothetical protein
MRHIDLDFYSSSGFLILLVTLTTLAFAFAPGVRKYRWAPHAGLIFWTTFGLVILARHYHAIDLVRYVLSIN